MKTKFGGEYIAAEFTFGVVSESHETQVNAMAARRHPSHLFNGIVIG
jgi:hypothetical protein